MIFLPSTLVILPVLGNESALLLEGGGSDPIIFGRNQNTYSNRVVIPGPCTIIYEYENPQTECGARAWIETYSEPMPANGCTYQEIIGKLPEKSESKSDQKSRQKSSGKGFALDSHPVAV